MQPEKTRKLAARLVDLACSSIWAMESEWLPVILDILTRENESIDVVEAKLGRKLDNTRNVTNRDGIAIIPVVGPLVRYADAFSEISGATSVETLATDFTAALTDPSVRGIVFTFNSPGGQVDGISEFADMVNAATGKKPMAGHVERASSGGYWIAAALPFLQINDTGHAGNIGVVYAVENPAAKAGPPKRIEIVSDNSPLKRPDVTTEAGQSLLRRYANETYDVFAGKVAGYRNVPVAKVIKDFGQGANRIGADAVKNKMADRVGSLEGLIADMQQRPKSFLTSARAEEETQMTILEKIKALVNGEPAEEKPAPEPNPKALEVEGLAAENAKLKEQLATEVAKATEKIKAAEKVRAEAAVRSFMLEHGDKMGKALYDVVEPAYRQAQETNDTAKISTITEMVKAMPPIGAAERVKAGGEAVDAKARAVASDKPADPNAPHFEALKRLEKAGVKQGTAEWAPKYQETLAAVEKEMGVTRAA